MSWTQKFSFSRDPVILDLKLQLAISGRGYPYSPLNISELCFLKCEFEHDDLGLLVVGLTAKCNR